MKRNKKGQFVEGKPLITLNEKLLVELYSKGLSLKDVGFRLSVSPNTVMRRLAKLNIKRRVGDFQKGHLPIIGSEKGQFKKGQRSAAWKGGIRFTSGYKEIWCDVRKKYVKEHRYIFELHLGRELKKEELIHHINKNRLDNRIENLQLMTNSEHATLHGTENYKNGTSGLCKINNKN